MLLKGEDCWPFVRRKYQRVYPQCQSETSIDGPSIWLTRNKDHYTFKTPRSHHLPEGRKGHVTWAPPILFLSRVDPGAIRSKMAEQLASPLIILPLVRKWRRSYDVILLCLRQSKGLEVSLRKVPSKYCDLTIKRHHSMGYSEKMELLCESCTNSYGSVQEEVKMLQVSRQAAREKLT
ncbi:hypothetical protein TNCV_3314381 [Trichonephila clavipes]|nr:hypothetical protein TNCV_3314381 [Trichonephila clavipes]